MPPLTQDERLRIRLQELMRANPGRVIAITILVDRNGVPVTWWPQVVAQAEGPDYAVRQKDAPP